MHGQFIWYDAMTTDVDAARDFYTGVVGWGVDTTFASSGYTVFTAGGQGVAGLSTLPEAIKAQGVPPCWTGYIGVDDVDAMAVRLKDAGGTVHTEPSDVPGVIRFAVVADPQGARFIIARGLNDGAPPPLPPGTPGTAGWRELYATDWTTVFPFYERLFGWEKRMAVDMGAMGTYQLFGLDGQDIGGMMTRPPQIPFSCWSYYFTVDALDAATARATLRGGQIMHGPVEVPGGQWIAQCLDPQGASFALVAPHR